jgi:uncharacterized protein (DUF427 family)
MSEKLPRWAELGRQGWTHTGARRPSFAEAPGPGQESVWDYPRPPALVGDDREVVVRWHGATLAETRRAARVLETSHPPTFYLPPDDIDLQYLVKKGVGSRCEWKGEATYWDVVVGDHRSANGAWSYEAPFAEFAAIRGYVSFYPGRFECFVDGERVKPQGGGFYGGWITPELVGPFKGDAGTMGW